MSADLVLRIAASPDGLASDPLFCRTPVHGDDQRCL
jgi:hypothetical protein